ncbi:MAG: hypothetical protein ABS95_02160 [Verrucomicrobia bacterium SCN 57-15]|nr:MAG: hypothetical protein ABS95_02160 [Verrucomicrobia bacterium SCN 57-15]
MEDSEPDMDQIRQNILEKLRQRFAKMEQGNTERFDRVLALWIDLQRAILSREKSDDPKGECAPWESADKSVRDAWDKFTEPNNLLSLESLFYQLPEGPQMEMARKALQFCRDRHARKARENESGRPGDTKS